MKRPTIIPFGGAFGKAFKDVWDAIDSLRPQSSPGVLTSHTTRGVTRRPIQRTSAAANPFTLCTVKTETRQWLKCQTPEQEDTEEYTWVAKPPALRCEVAVTAETYPAVSIWGAAFVGEKYLYRDTTERLKLWAPAGGDSPFSLSRPYTPYERWPSGIIKTDVDAFRGVTYGGFVSQIGNVDYIFSFEKVHPIYNDYNRVGSRPHQGQPRTIYAASLHPDDAPDEVPMIVEGETEVPDPTFEASEKLIDFNLDGRRWMPAHEVHPLAALVFNAGMPWAAVSYLPEQYSDQLWGNDTPVIKSLLPSFWPELQS